MQRRMDDRRAPDEGAHFKMWMLVDQLAKQIAKRGRVRDVWSQTYPAVKIPSEDENRTPRLTQGSL